MKRPSVKPPKQAHIVSQIEQTKMEIMSKKALEIDKIPEYDSRHKVKGKLLPSIPIKKSKSNGNIADIMIARYSR